MLFNSFGYILFLPIVIIIYYLLDHKYRWVLLLIASYYFYMCWKAEYAILIAFSTLIDYYAAKYIEKTDSSGVRKALLVLSLSINLGVLFVFKYFNFLSASLTESLAYFNILYESPIFNLLLPVGISFYTFQSMSYTINVYLGKHKAEQHLGYFALYVSFFPQLVAGPIERPDNLLPQFRENIKANYENISEGVKLIIWGLFIKMIIADRAAIFVNEAYNNVDDYSGVSFIIATILFAFQIYCDFAGYSTVAIGSAKLMGFDLMENFRRPYGSKSIGEFWKRWHISLSTWFRDYLYIPLGGNRVSKSKHLINLFVVFTVSGLWHGANWTFLIWGALHSTYLIVEVLSAKIRKRLFENYAKLQKWGGLIITFILVCFAWIFFRSNTVEDSFTIISKMVNLSYYGDYKKDFLLNQSVYDFTLLVSFLALLHFVYFVKRDSISSHIVLKAKNSLNIFFYAFLIVLIFLFTPSSQAEFIYFQF